MLPSMTDAAKCAAARADVEARQLHHEYVCSIHLLLAIVALYGDTLSSLRSMTLRLGELREIARARTPREPPETLDGRRAIEASIEAASIFHDSEVDVLHLLWGCLSHEDRLARSVLLAIGCDPSELLLSVERDLGTNGPE